MSSLHYITRLLSVFVIFITLTSSSPRRLVSSEHFVTNEAELVDAIGKSVPGDIIIMKNGIWNNIDIVFKSRGAENKPITLKAETAGQVIISGASSLRLAGEYLIVEGLHFKNGHSSRNFHLIEFRDGKTHANHCRITNIAISKFNKESGTDVWIGLYGKHNQVDHSLFEGKVSRSVLMIVWRPTDDANHHRIDHNHFKDMPSIGLGGAIAIRIGDGTNASSSSATVVESNIFENMLGIGKIINIKSSGNIIRGNTFIKASGSITIRHGNNNLIEGNYIFPGLRDNYTGGILVIGENHIIRNNYIQGTRRRGKPAITLYQGDANNYPGKGSYYPTKNILIANNTLIDNDKNICIGQKGQVAGMPDVEMAIPVENITYKQNVIIGNTSTTPLIEVLEAPKGEIIYEGNLFFNGNVEGLKNIPGISIEDPLLTLGSDSAYHYNTGSPLKNNLLAPPLQKNEVGPTWIN
ncbi:hypothetical protein G5B00_15950 [Parapedobacter sp. SGR-10]|uniref:polysaccharide lyase 6 family protein n=1 Tax=Parapedobacter sp. SGR-10 TaxID=2710879 RepID=UPI0013D799B7|nr:polysaccharide lyase 6 family protein [Parapedobacter sp. SGR-10]NGF58010.1 hypothetical protein [Parapedobacter sp. SGR-10]